MTDQYLNYARIVAGLNHEHTRQMRALTTGAVLLAAVALAVGIWIGRSL